jgi:hypothetical protein
MRQERSCENSSKPGAPPEGARTRLLLRCQFGLEPLVHLLRRRAGAAERDRLESG